MLDSKAATFLCVCEEMNFTKAARVLSITQPAVTQHIHALEEYYGVPLFQFEGKRFRLTEYGSLIRDTLSSMQNNERYLRERLRIMKSKHGFVNMGATLTVAEFMITNYLDSYIKTHPEADISTHVANTAGLLSKLDNGEIDFAVLEGNYSKSGYEHLTLFNCDFVGICAPEANFCKSSYSLRELTCSRLILREAGSGTREIFEGALREEQMALSDFRNVTTIGNMHTIIELVKRNCGITFLYRSAAKDIISAGGAKLLPVAGFPIHHEISSVWRKDNAQGKYVRSLVKDMFKIKSGNYQIHFPQTPLQ